MEQEELRVLDYTEYPGPRYCVQGNFSGEDFYLKVLNKKFNECYKNNKKLILDIDGTGGYPSSFLDEAFGELVFDFSLDVVKKHLEIVTLANKKRKQRVLEETFPQWEKRRISNDSIMNTVAGTKLYKIGTAGKEEYRITQKCDI